MASDSSTHFERYGRTYRLSIKTPEDLEALLVALANSFASFPDLYDPDRAAMFEMGRLIMDGRRFNLCVRVDNRVEHSTFAKTGNIFLVYAEIIPKQGGQDQYEVVAPVTAGGKGNMCVGKPGVFVDVNDRLCDTRVVQIIANPISVGEAMLSPFHRLGNLLSGRIERWSFPRCWLRRSAPTSRPRWPPHGSPTRSRSPRSSPSPTGWAV